MCPNTRIALCLVWSTPTTGGTSQTSNSIIFDLALRGEKLTSIHRSTTPSRCVSTSFRKEKLKSQRLGDRVISIQRLSCDAPWTTYLMMMEKDYFIKNQCLGQVITFTSSFQVVSVDSDEWRTENVIRSSYWSRIEPSRTIVPCKRTTTI